MKKTIYSLVIIIIVIVLIVLLIFLNINSKKDNINNITSTTTTTQSDLVGDSRIININIDNIDVSMNVSTYTSYLGFKIDYDVDNFKIVKETNAIKVEFLGDSNVYLEIIKQNANDFTNDYKEYGDDNNYRFLRGNETYFKIKINYSDDQTVSSVINYMLSTIYLS